jgi:hypothetical protein
MVRADRVAQILAEVLRPDSAGGGLSMRLVDIAFQALMVTGAGLAWMTDSGPAGTLAATNGAAEVLEDLQYTLGAGPGVDCCREGVPEFHPDLSQIDSGRWPGYTDRALAAGISAVFAFPLQVGGIKLGVLDLYNARPGPLDHAAVEEARALAGAATALLLHLQSSASPNDMHPDLADAVIDRAEVHQATGMISAQIGSTLSDAFAVLRGRAFASGRGINDVAHSVVTRQTRFTDDDR